MLKPGAQFVGLPGVFLFHYKDEIGSWLRDFRQRGHVCKLWLKQDVLGPMVIGDGSSLPMVPSIIHVQLRGTLFNEGQNLVVTPYSIKDEKKIAQHCKDLEQYYDKGEATIQ